MHFYPVYGAILESSMPLPELQETAPSPAHWTFRTEDHLPAARNAVEIGCDLIYGSCFARLTRHERGHRITVDDTGVFDLSEDRRHVVWCNRAESWPEFVRAHLLNRVLGTSLFLEGLLPLHASAVATADGVIAFLAPKGFGKSTLALALHSLGAAFVSDDTLPVDPSDPVLVRPGIPSARVRDDALEILGVTHDHEPSRDGKQLLTVPSGARAGGDALPLCALYMLESVEAPAGADAPIREVQRHQLPPAVSAISVISHVKIGRMLGADAAGPMLAHAARIVRSVPVFALQVPRALERLRPTAERILAWHGGPA